MGLQMSLVFRFPPEKCCRPIIGQAERLCFGFLLAFHYTVYWYIYILSLYLPYPKRLQYNHHHWQLPDCHRRFSPDLATCRARLATLCAMLRAAPLGRSLVHKGRVNKMKGPESGYHQRRRDGFISWMKCQCFGALMCNTFLDGKGNLVLVLSHTLCPLHMWPKGAKGCPVGMKFTLMFSNMVEYKQYN